MSPDQDLRLQLAGLRVRQAQTEARVDMLMELCERILRRQAEHVDALEDRRETIRQLCGRLPAGRIETKARQVEAIFARERAIPRRRGAAGGSLARGLRAGRTQPAHGAPGIVKIFTLRRKGTRPAEDGRVIHPPHEARHARPQTP